MDLLGAHDAENHVTWDRLRFKSRVSQFQINLDETVAGKRTPGAVNGS